MRFIEVEHKATDQTTTVPETAVQHLSQGWTVVFGADTDAADPDAGNGEGEDLFDPEPHTVDEVNEYLTYATVEERDRVLELEKNGKARVGIVGA
jgi:hypothetical protein